ncbi:MAG: hypothetical protein ACPLKV_01160 [Minisyncoccia bacterium]
MKELIEEFARRFFIVLILLGLLAALLLFSSCTPLGITMAVDTNLPIQTTRITVINATPYYFYVLIDGEEKGVVESYGKWVGGLWNGSYYGVQVALQIIDKKGFAYSDALWVYSSYSRYSYTFTIRQGSDGRLYVERR